MLLLLEDKHEVEQLINAHCHSSAITDQKSRGKMEKKNNMGESHGVMKWYWKDKFVHPSWDMLSFSV